MAPPRTIRNATARHASNVNKRGSSSLKAASKEEQERETPSRLGNFVMGFLFFVVVGSMLTPIFQKIASGPVF